MAAGGAGEPPAELLDECVRAALGLTGAEAVRVFRKAWLAAGALDGAGVAHVLREKQKALRRVTGLSIQDAYEDLAQVGGLGELKRWLAERRRAFGAEARAFGLPVPRGLLLLGVQGCGKSLAAKAVASEWRFPLLRLDLAAAFGDRTHSPELTMREATAVAEGRSLLEKGTRYRTIPLRAVHTIYGMLILQAARQANIGRYAQEEKQAIEWLLRHPDEASGGFYGHRVFSWSTAKAISALSVTEMRDAKFPRRRPEYAGQKAGGPFIFVAVLLLAFYTYDLTVKNLLGLPQVVFLIFFMLALLLAYERILGKFFQEFVQGLLELLKSKWD